MGDGVNDQKLSAYNIKQACEKSLQRLKTGHIDLYQMHHVDRETPWEEIWQAMEQLVREGKIIYVGSSNFAGWHIATANQIAIRRNFLGLVSEQSIYHLANRNIELEVLPVCRGYGLGVIPWSPLAGGMLAGVLKNPKGGRRLSEEMQKAIKKNHAKLEQYEGLCEELGEEPANIGLAWLLAQSGLTGPIIGPRTVAQLTGSLKSVEIKLDESTLKKLDEIWPGPGGQAPEAYAW
jgi:aryl-alcohol dehydrogenase-like predicted oxidoreductase